MLSIILMIVFAVLGIIAIATGKLTLTKNKVVLGIPARLLGMVLLTPFPIIAVISAVYVIAASPADPEKFAKDNIGTFAVIEIATLAVVALIVFGIGAAIGQPAPKKKSKSRDDEYEDEDRPRRRGDRDNDDEDEDDDRPRRRRDDDEER